MDLNRRIQQHELVGNMYETWCSVANQLFGAARILKRQQDGFDREGWIASHIARTIDQGNGLAPLHLLTEAMPDETQVLAPLLMLRGMGVECLLKALWLKQGHKLVQQGAYEDIPGTRQHDLVGLAQQTGFSLSTEENHVLVKLTDFITHHGRYPIPKKGQEHLRMVNVPGGGKASTGGWSTPSDEILFDNLVSRLHRDLGWP